MTTRHRLQGTVGALALGVLIGASCAPAHAPPVAEQVLEVVGTEYAFQVPDTVSPGRTVVRLRNVGRVLHEVILMKLQPGVPTDSLLAQAEWRSGFRQFVDGGNAVLFAPPARTGDGELVVDLEPGRDYLLWCNFTDGKGTPRHAALGMLRRVHVRAEPAPPPAPPAREVVVAAGDYRFVAPDTLAAGVVEFRIRNVGRQRHEISLSRLKAGTSAAFFLDELQKGSDVDSLYDDDGAVLTAYPGDDNRTAIRATLRAGHEYVLVCEFRDAPGAPTHLALGMTKGIVVRGN
jgi:hypothetical protein